MPDPAFDLFVIGAGSGGVLLRSWQRNRPEEGRNVEILAADGTKRTVDWFPSLER